MRFVRFNSATNATKPDWFASALSQLARKLLPSANPDFEHEYHQVQYWWLELDDNEIPQREIGFDGQGSPLVAAPLGPNFGCFTDSTAPSTGLTPVPQDAFELKWQQVVSAWESQRSSRMGGSK